LDATDSYSFPKVILIFLGQPVIAPEQAGTAGYVEIHKEFVGKIPRTLLSLTQQGREALQADRQNMMQVFENLPG
jgi:hypothetical protein